MTTNDKYSKWLFIVFPAVAMMLGWGLRGHIGGGPFGAMIPGAMVAITICMLLELPATFASLLVVFGVVGIGLGGEMTYGQTLGFLRQPDTVRRGILATTIKGSVWGIFGGAVLSAGFLVKKLSKKTIAISFLVMMVGMMLGFKLINEPMLIYFSDPVKPRSESWAALLLGALALIIYLKTRTPKDDFKVVWQFSKWGLIGGGLGFGIGGLWMVMGSRMPEGIMFHAWWKAMEFTFGLLLGGALGLAAWINRKQLKGLVGKGEQSESYNFKTSVKELGIALIVGLLIFWFISFALTPIESMVENNSGFLYSVVGAIVGIFENYVFAGLIMVMAALYFPKAAWQIGISLTFCHTVIDLSRDHIVKVVETNPQLVGLLSISLATLLVGLFVAWYQGKENKKRNMLMILTWSTVLLSTYKIIYYPQKMNPDGSFGEVIIGLFVVDITFLVLAIAVTWMALKKIQV